MAQSKGQRGYNAYLRKAKRKFGITHAQAIRMYRLQRDHSGEPINSRSIDRHPRLASRFAKAAIKPPRSRKAPTRTAMPKASVGSRRAVGVREATSPKRIRTIRDWELQWDLADDYEDIVIEAGVDTGRRKKK